MDPLSALISAGSSLLGGLMQGGGEPEPAPTDMWGIGRTKIGEETELEKLLAALQASMGTQGMQAAQGDLAAAPSMQDILAGRINPTMGARFDQLAFGGLQQAGMEADRYATERALGQGMDFSSQQGAWQAQAMQPAMVQAMQYRGQLEMAEIQRQAEMRQRAMGNLLALQDSPALSRLLQIRMQEATTSQTQMGRDPWKLPKEAYTQEPDRYRSNLQGQYGWA